ncbi:hypothetical protein TRIP_B250428 [uncultured Desulfatiglans sp.]|nr:hypothetical protein TRIP_B250428 [uncultured Desulfatiglans sp.]
MGDYIDNNPIGVYNPGDEISYAFRVKNTGNVTLTNITISDAIPEVTVNGGPINSLAPGETDTMTFTGSYTLTQNDIDAGEFKNTATAFGTPPSGPNVSDDDDDTQPMTTGAALDLVKSADPMEYGAIDQVITYTFEVTNIGNVTIKGPITINDDKATDESCPAGDLPPGGSITCLATYTITQNDLDFGSVTNTATASGQYDEQTIISNEDTVTIVAAIGVCCLPDGQCVILTEQECTQQDGIFDGTLQSCDGVDCFIAQGLGACCLPDGTCVDRLHEAECIDQGGQFMGVGVVCTQGLCPRPALPVPTISPWGLMLLSMLTGGLGVLALRRKSKKS